MFIIVEDVGVPGSFFSRGVFECGFAHAGQAEPKAYKCGRKKHTV